MDCFRVAMEVCGVPERLFTDNGRVYIGRQLKQTCAKLAISLRRTRPYAPASKGKIETLNRTLEKFVVEEKLEHPSSVEQVQHDLDYWVESFYYDVPHSALDGKTPRSFEAMKKTIQSGGRKNRKRPSNLRAQVNPLMLRACVEARAEAAGSNFWRTPSASDGEGGIMRMGQGGRYKLRDQVMPINADYAPQMYPTPIQSSYRNARRPVTLAKAGRKPSNFKCLGNAVVPQQVYPILAGISEILKEERK